MATEGNLQAPTRHPLDWKNPAFYNEDSLNHELERVFDICHGCRRCVSLCGAFPTLFDLVKRCSGHAGTFGVKKEFHATAMKIGKPVFKAMAGGSTDVAPDYISSGCQLAGHHILQGMREAGLKQAKMAHPLTLLRLAYGI